MSILNVQWAASVSQFVNKSKNVKDAMYSHSTNGTTNWASTKEGKELLLLCESAWHKTISFWTDPERANESLFQLKEYTNCTIDLLNSMSADYVYRTNNAVPSDQLWESLEQKINMPALCEDLSRAWRDCYKIHTITPHYMHLRMSLIALARNTVPYVLYDTQENQYIWQDIEELANYWRTQPNPDVAKHASMVRGMTALPSSIESFYDYALTNALPEETVHYALDHFAPEATQHPTEVMNKWCQWLSSTQHSLSIWSHVQKKMPALANIVQIVSALSTVNVGQSIWSTYCTQRQDVMPIQEIGGFFDAPF